MPERDAVLRSMHGTELAAWFGGSLMGAVGVISAAAGASSPGALVTPSPEHYRKGSNGFARG